MLWIQYTVPFGFSLLWHILDITFQLLNYFVWLRIADDGSMPEMSISYILLIKSSLERYILKQKSLAIITEIHIEINTNLIRFLLQDMRLQSYPIPNTAKLHLYGAQCLS